MDSFTKIVDALSGALSTRAKLAKRLGIENPDVVRQWRNNNTIPMGYWRSVVDLAADVGVEGVTLEALSEIAEKKRAA